MYSNGSDMNVTLGLMHGGDDQTMGKLMFLYTVILSLLCRYDRISGRIQVRQPYSSSNAKKVITTSEASPSSKKAKGMTKEGSPMLARKMH